MNDWKRTFFTIWIGQAFSQLSSSVLQMAIVWYLVATTNSPFIIAISGIMAFLPQGFLGLFIGTFIDRHNRKTIMAVSDLCIALASLVLVFAGHNGELPIWLIMLVLFVRSVGTAFHVPSLQAVTPLIVPAEQLGKCAGYSQTFSSASLILSPAIAAALYAIWPINAIIALDVFGALIAVATLILVKIPNQVSKTKQQFWQDTADGLKVIKAQKLLDFMCLNAVFSFLYMPIFVLYPMMTLSYFAKSEWHAGFVEILFAIGMLIGSLVLGFWGGTKKRIPLISTAALVMGLSLCISGLLRSDQFWLFIICSLILGLASPFYHGLQITVYQENIPADYLGRVLSVSGAVSVIAVPIGIILSGYGSEVFGVELWFLLSGFLLLIISWLYSRTNLSIDEKSI